MAADRVAEAFADERLVRLDGFHALKHALRFGAEVVAAAAEDVAALDELARRLAPDVRERIAALTVERPLAGLVPRGAAHRRRGGRAAPAVRAAAAPAGRPPCCSRTRATSATSARSCASPPRRAPPPC